MAFKVLVVDDDEVNRLILEGMLVDAGHEVIQASNGLDAIEVFQNEQPGLVLMDIMMPGMSGYEATHEIKQIAGDRYVPVMVLTAMTDEDELVKCVNNGADDFLTKPFSQTVLMAKIKALMRTQQLYQTVQKQRDELDSHHAHILAEQEAAVAIYQRLVRKGELDNPNVRYHITALSIFNGDLLLVSKAPEGNLNIILADATGHGLPAAIGSMPVTEIFYATTQKGCGIDTIVKEMNRKLESLLPTGFFLCACIMSITDDHRHCTIWNGGMPDIIVYDAQQKAVTAQIKSNNLPLGIVSNDEYEVTLEEITLNKQDRVLLHSDGVTEASNEKNEYFGQQRLLQCIEANRDPEKLIDEIIQTVTSFSAELSQSDDMSLVEFIADSDL